MMELPINTILQGDALHWLPKLPAASVHCCVTSPPYWGLRDYGIAPTKWPAVTYTIFGKKHRVKAMTCCLGLEPTPEAFTGHIVLLFRQLHRVLRNDGTLWLNLGDSYAQGSKNRTAEQAARKSTLIGSKGTQISCAKQPNKIVGLLKPKDLVGIPWMVAFALRDDGWYLRQDDIWAKDAVMPESVTDRCTKSHEYLFQLSKKRDYYYDHVAIKEDAVYDVDDQQTIRRKERVSDDVKCVVGEKINAFRKLYPEGKHGATHQSAKTVNGTRNKRSVWRVNPKPFPEAHFATFPQELIIDCIKAGTSEHGCCSDCGAPHYRQYENVLTPGPKAAKTNVVDARDMVADKQDQGSNRQKDGHLPGHLPGHFNAAVTTGWTPSCKCEIEDINVIPAVVLDLFMGAGTTAVTARKLNRNFIGIELNEKYIAIAEKRLQKELGLFK
jgi:DNA modification methylase